MAGFEEHIQCGSFVPQLSSRWQFCTASSRNHLLKDFMNAFLPVQVGVDELCLFLYRILRCLGFPYPANRTLLHFVPFHTFNNNKISATTCMLQKVAGIPPGIKNFSLCSLQALWGFFLVNKFKIINGSPF